MSAAETNRREFRKEGRLWVSILAPSLAWITALIVSFLLASEVCATGRRWILYLVTGSAFFAAAAGAVAGWRTWRRLEDVDEPPDSIGARRRFMAVAGLLLAIYFGLAILALAIPQIVHRPCD
jgi:hypothetical protein